MTIWKKIDVAGDLQPVMAKARGKVADVFERHGEDLFITAQRDGIHSNGSLHPEGLAMDFRPPMTNHNTMYREIVHAVGPAFDLVTEGNHWHLEYDPK